MKRLVFLITLVFAFPSYAATWLCKVEDGAGYFWNSGTKSFQPQIFTVNDTYIIRPFNDTDTKPNYAYQDAPPKYVAVELGDDEPVAFWWADLEEANGTRTLLGRYELQFFAKTNELIVEAIWYSVSRPHEEREEFTPYFAIGNCSKLEK